MEITNLQVRHDFNAWFKQHHVDYFDTDDMAFYGKPDIEQNAYYILFLESKGIIVSPGINVSMEKKFYGHVYFLESGESVALAVNYEKAQDAVADAIRYGLKHLSKPKKDE